MQSIDIYSKGQYPADALSNFAAHPFVFDGVACAGMEGFLQSLKFRGKSKQVQVCALSGKEAKNAGSSKFLWKLTGNLYWQGKRYKRGSKDFDKLRERAYFALAEQSEGFRKALSDSRGKELKHSKGKHSKRGTVLTEKEFINYLESLRGGFMKVIFLDIDGVLNSRRYDSRRNWNEQTDIDETRLPLVKEIVGSTGAKIVLSSTWRTHWDKDPEKCDVDGEYINKTFAKFGLEIYGKTPDFGLGGDRGDEVKSWLFAFDGFIKSYVIIDDYRYNWGGLSPFFVKTNPHLGLGLEEEHVKQAVEILNAPSDR